MTSPYTAQPVDAFMAAQTSVALVLGALLWFRRLGSWSTTLLLLVAIAISVTAPIDGEFLSGIGITVDVGHVQRELKLAAALAMVSTLLARRPLLVAVAALGEAALWVVTGYVQHSEAELAGAHLAFFGLLIGLHWRTRPSVFSATRASVSEPSNGAWVDDAAALLLGTLAGALMCRVLLHGWTDSGDEWANTFQAALFAKMRAYGSVPHCSEAFRMFWVFQYLGRSFAQYTPGWPLFMAPFVRSGVAWLAGPASLGLLAAGVTRLGRRAASGFTPGTQSPSAAHVRAAGRLAALAVLLGSTMLINGGSRYPHLFVAATFAWSVEALFVISTATLAARRQWTWGTVLGASAAFLLATRPSDGCTLGIGLFSYFCYALVRRRMGWRAIAGAAIAFGAIGGLTLVILRLQLGRWFATGYSISALIYPWNRVEWSLPQPDEYKWGIRLATGAYCWWPCSPAIGLAGIAALRGRSQRMGFVFFLSYVPFIAFYTLLVIGRGVDFGYGPRYSLPCVVPMAVGTGVVLAQLWTAARARWTETRALDVGGPAAIAFVAVLLGVVRIAPLVYPATYADVQNHSRLHEALALLHLRSAVVFAGAGLTNTDLMDLPENLPLELYPDQDLLIAIDRGPELERCVRELYPTRSLYRAVPGPPVQIIPLQLPKAP
jgi:hypothetical protein